MTPQNWDAGTWVLVLGGIVVVLLIVLAARLDNPVKELLRTRRPLPRYDHPVIQIFRGGGLLVVLGLLIYFGFFMDKNVFLHKGLEQHAAHTSKISEAGNQLLARIKEEQARTDFVDSRRFALNAELESLRETRARLDDRAAAIEITIERSNESVRKLGQNLIEIDALIARNKKLLELFKDPPVETSAEGTSGDTTAVRPVSVSLKLEILELVKEINAERPDVRITPSNDFNEGGRVEVVGLLQEIGVKLEVERHKVNQDRSAFVNGISNYRNDLHRLKRDAAQITESMGEPRTAIEGIRTKNIEDTRTFQDDANILQANLCRLYRMVDMTEMLLCNQPVADLLKVSARIVLPVMDDEQIRSYQNWYYALRALVLGAIGAIITLMVPGRKLDEDDEIDTAGRRSTIFEREDFWSWVTVNAVLGCFISVIGFGLLFTNTLSLDSARANDAPEYWRMAIICLIAGAFAEQFYKALAQRVDRYSKRISGAPEATAAPVTEAPTTTPPPTTEPPTTRTPD